MSNARFSIIQARAVEDARITNAQFRTLAALGKYGDKEGWCWPKLKTLGKDLHKSAQAVSKDIVALVKYGYVEKHPQFEENIQKPNLYRLIHDPPPQPDDETPSTSGVETPSTSEVEQNVPSNVPSKSWEQRKKEAQERIEAQRAAKGDPVEMWGKMSAQATARAEMEDRIYFATGLTPNTRWQTEGIIDFLLKKDKAGETIEEFAEKVKVNPYEMPKFFQIAQKPSLLRDNWGLAFPPEAPGSEDDDLPVHVHSLVPGGYAEKKLKEKYGDAVSGRKNSDQS